LAIKVAFKHIGFYKFSAVPSQLFPSYRLIEVMCCRNVSLSWARKSFTSLRSSRDRWLTTVCFRLLFTFALTPGFCLIVGVCQFEAETHLVEAASHHLKCFCNNRR